jgi:hypothetical protein
LANNVLILGAGAIGGGLGSKDMLATGESVAFAHAAIGEVCAIAKAAGHPLPEDTADRQIAGTQRMANHVSSMGQDWLAGRPMETEALLGNAVRIARRLGSPGAAPGIALRPAAHGGEPSPGPSGSCMSTLSTQRPNL